MNYVVETNARGRNRWPNELKQEVADRIVGGQSFESIAVELGTTLNMIRKWWLEKRPEGYSLSPVEDPFTELQIVDGPESVGSTVVSASRFTVNGITLEAQRDIALSELTALLQAMGNVR